MLYTAATAKAMTHSSAPATVKLEGNSARS